MAAIKTLVNDSSINEFIGSIEDPKRLEDGKRLLAMYQQATGETATMWGTSLVGFGRYHYKSERSTQEGDWPLAAFSPRKQNLSLYFMQGFDAYKDLLDRLGKHKTGKGCLYINKLTDVNLDVLGTLIERGYRDAKQLYT